VNIGEAMEKIAKEAGHQGFRVTQTLNGAWQFSRDGHVTNVKPQTATEVRDAVSDLIRQGLTWPPS